MSYFKIIMPNYNNSQWLEKSVGSVLEQTFKDYLLVFIDDVSTDDSIDKAGSLISDKGIVIGLKEKRWNGGARNVGLKVDAFDSTYTLFLDSDDWFTSPDILQKLHDFIEEHDQPECVRLPYRMEVGNAEPVPVMLNDNNADKLCNSIFVACWTKCIKSELIVPFPENTLMEDVVQHIAQCDKIRYPVEVFTEPVVAYNRNNTNSCSAEKNQDLQHGKWQSSMYRYMADLLDLELEHDYCKRQRDWRAGICLDNIKKGVYSQSVL